MRDQALLPPPVPGSAALLPPANVFIGVSARWGTRTLTAAAALLAAITAATLHALLQAPELPAAF